MRPRLQGQTSPSRFNQLDNSTVSANLDRLARLGGVTWRTTAALSVSSEHIPL
jgi:hypothetical protein